MSRKLPIFYGALLLTGVNLLLRFLSTSFQVYLSALIGPEGIGLIQLVLSLSGLAMTMALAGIRTTTMYLTAEDLGQGRRDNIPWVLTGCFGYCFATSGTVGLLLYQAAPVLARHWIGSMDALPALRCFAAFLPICCLCGVMTGYFTAANRITTLATVEVGEQLVSMALTLISLKVLSPGTTAGSCLAIVLGSSGGYALTLTVLLFLYRKDRRHRGSRRPIVRRLLTSALPLAVADNLKGSISTLENLMVPRRLARYPGIAHPLAAFGIISGMVFPIMMFPSALLFSLAEVLIPELARCAACGSNGRISYLTRQNLRVTLLYGLICGGILFLLAEPLCARLYPHVLVAPYLKWFSLLVPMLYCDLIVDAMTKGLGQQRACVRYNILTNALDVVLLFFLLPRLGIAGYYLSFLVTHVLNFCLSLRHLVKIVSPHFSFAWPCLSISAYLISLVCASRFTGWVRPSLAFAGLFFSISYWFGVWNRQDLLWLKGLFHFTQVFPT